MALQILKLFRTESRLSCSFHTSCFLGAKPGRAMNKIMGVSKKKKRIYSDVPILPKADTFSRGSQEGRYSGDSRRATVLNKLFMKHITDLMATGENAPEFLGLGIEINKVQISPDFNGLNVFWVAKGNDSDDVVEEALAKNAGFLRHELSTLRVMGMVPMIKFVKDKHYSQIIELDNRLAQADFGEDYEPVQIETKMKTHLELYTPLDPQLKEKIETLDGEIEEEISEEPLPPMVQDVLGLNHSDILLRVQKAMKKSEAVHRLSSCSAPEGLYTLNENPIEFASAKERRAAFKDFLEKRELTRSSDRKLDKNYIPDLELIKEMYIERQGDFFKNMDVYDNDDFDYIDEEVEKEK